MSIFALPESSRRVLAVLTSSDSIGFTQLKEKTGLAERTLRFSLSRLRKEGLVQEFYSFEDMRRKLIKLRR